MIQERNLDPLTIVEAVQLAIERRRSQIRVLPNIHDSEYLDLQRVAAWAKHAHVLDPSASRRPLIRVAGPSVRCLHQ